MYNNQKNPPKSNKYTTRAMGYGIICGIVVGVFVGRAFKYQVPSILIAIIAFMAGGYFLGKKMDKDLNDQLKNFAYAIKEVSYKKDEDTYEVVLVDKKDKEKILNIKADKYKSLGLKKFDLVHLRKDGQISPAYPKAREQKQSPLVEMVDQYQKIKEEKKKKE
jgi:uncharacterized membrane protein YfbV (UPF0208 family)